MRLGQTSTIEEFEAAALPHLNDLFRTALRISRNHNQAEDLVQETYLQAWKSFHRFELGTNCRAWLYTILFHVIHHHRRKWYNFIVPTDEEHSLEETLVYEPPVSEVIKDEDMLAAFERIPEQYREVVLLADVQEFAYKEIANILKIPIGTVMSRLSRGRKLLRTELAQFAPTVQVRNAAEGGQGA